MSYKVNCICLDDELPALRLIETYCKKIPEINLLQSFSNPEKALEFIKANNNIDIAIIDIQMSGINGVDFYKKINKNILGIFISANSNYAIQAYEIDIVDFIQKPATFERFEKAYNKANNFLKIKQTEPENYITVKHEYISKKIKLSDIQFIEGSGEYIKIVTAQKTYLQFQRLKDFEEENLKNGFIRIHKSYLVLKQHIVSYKSNTVVLKNGENLPIGRVYKGNFGV
ncbi:MAG: LytTR family DNA-binding domain-containing protein [Bacteroidota bacterium]|nr:LytTR family DNA-binding domain-containing protein [Bacteroidota bacterium]